MPTCKSHLNSVYRSLPNTPRAGYLRLDMNECIPGLSDAWVQEVLAGVTGAALAMYPEYKVLTTKIAEHDKIEPGNVSLFNGSATAIKYLFDTYVHPNDTVLLTDPTYAMYPVFAQLFEARADVVKYKEDLSLPIGDFLSGLARAPRMAVVVNPNNPTGHVLEPQELYTIIKKSAEYDVLLLVDEAYFYFYPHTIIEEVKRWPHLVVLRTFSKLFGMASARLGYVAACPQIVDNLRKMKLNFEVNGIAVRLAEHLLDRPDLIENMVARSNEGKRFLVDRLKQSEIEYRAGAANFILIRCANRVNEVTNKLAEKGILVGNGFKQEFLKDYIRVTTGHRLAMEQFWSEFADVMGVAYGT